MLQGYSVFLNNGIMAAILFGRTRMTVKSITQEFRGYVESVCDQSGLATVVLYDLTEPSNPEECAEIDFSNTSARHIPVKPGYIFTWTLGFELNEQGNTVREINEFSFLTIDKTEAEKIAASIQEAKAPAREIAKLFK